MRSLRRVTLPAQQFPPFRLTDLKKALPLAIIASSL
jgi:hypothetical protein